jgi:DNA polymerase-3 subunit delta'
MQSFETLHPDLQQMLQTASIPSTLLLVGASEKEALEFAVRLMGDSHRHKIENLTHPDLHLYRPEGKSLIHPMESMQNLIREVYLPPFEAAVKVFILTHAERMLPTSSNALLKTLEEPPQGVYFLLLTSAPQQILITILSRSRKVTFGLSQEKSPSIPLLIDILTNDNIIDRSQQIIDLEESLAPEDEDEGISYQQTDAILEQILFWYRDLHLLSAGGAPQHLFHSEYLDALSKRATRPFLSLEKVIPLIEECRFALQQHIKLRNVLEFFFLTA